MILVDTALRQRESEGRPVRVGMYGAGAMARGFVAQVSELVPGMEVVAIANRTLQKAADAYGFAGRGGAVAVSNLAELDRAIAAGTPAITDDPSLLARSAGIDCLIDMTGAVNFGAARALEAIGEGKPLVLMNAEVDATVGPILHEKARRAGVLLTCCDGDQPGVELNLWRYVQGLGLTPRVLGNIKGLQDEYRTPTTQQGFAEQWHQDVTMVTSFADGSKVNFEQAIVANATGFTVAQRGMSRREHRGHIDELTAAYDLEQLRELGGVVDFVIGARPSPGVFCLAEMEDERHASYLALYKLGDGPLYSFYQPYHLCYLEAPMSVARAVLFGDAVGQPLGAPVVEVVAIAKRDLLAGESLDSFGRYLTYGQAEKASVVRAEGLLPEGLAEGCRLKRAIAKDQPIHWSDVEAPSEQLAHQLYAEQLKMPLAP
ncbi:MULTISPECIES: NAD(P)H-dependent oxidoreductase [unclassified Cyanobium]|uniref:NAD(P)H-dependent oxidoreductase n=1 Tax=unclassified Cyanobium TaxID=2627006 RepID=UPI0020CBFC3E|nr:MULTISPECIES: SAF domain-containing protein [unclassified Cyanobium]MCP9778599.1 NAD(P)-dependent oxidoreductase [Cyanobium sp. Tous-M-B4]MCP9876231.1 NAD(P)-dependent oxidoreductase [Cyanobium sp. A2C-AMD]